jgi:hypothetical protein
LYGEIARFYGKNGSSIRELMKSKQKIHAGYSVAPQTTNITAITPDKMLMKLEMP